MEDKLENIVKALVNVALIGGLILVIIFIGAAIASLIEAILG